MGRAGGSEAGGPVIAGSLFEHACGETFAVCTEYETCFRVAVLTQIAYLTSEGVGTPESPMRPPASKLAGQGVGGLPKLPSLLVSVESFAILRNPNIIVPFDLRSRDFERTELHLTVIGPKVRDVKGCAISRSCCEVASSDGRVFGTILTCTIN